MNRSSCIILVLIVSSYPKVRASIHDISMFRGYTTKDKKKNKVIPAGKKGVGDYGYSGEPNKIVTTRKGQSVEMKRRLGRVRSRQETFFSRVKSFNIMKNRFRHGKRGTKDKMIRDINTALNLLLLFLLTILNIIIFLMFKISICSIYRVL